MKKNSYALLFAIALCVSANAQTSLPTSWGFSTTTLPTGWSSTGSFNYYAASGNPAPAGKLQATGDKLIVNFSSTPGVINYDLVGNPPNGGTWGGSFKVEESVNGTSWTSVGATYTSLPTGYTSYTRTLSGASRYVRFNFATHSTGNVGIDNVSITAGVSTTQEISVKQNTTTIVNGGTYTLASPVSTLLSTTFSILNLGTVGTLNVSGVTITGPAASDYSVNSFPSTVAPTSNGNMIVHFTPSAAGTRLAALNIANDDPNGNPYIINLYGIGGSLATEPTTQASGLNFTNIKSYRYNGSFTAASPAPDGYLVLRKAGSAITDIPVDGTVYQRGDIIGNSKVVYSNSATTIYPVSDVVANTTYHFAIYAYNGTGTYRNYFVTAPLTGSVTTLGSMQPTNYYNTISTANATFVTNLHNKINPHTAHFYSNYGPYMVTNFYSRDTSNNQRVMTCVYSGQNKVYSDPWDWSTNNFSREHTYCHNWMATNPAQSLPEYNDYHHLFPTNQNDANAVRSNYPLGEVVTATHTYLGCKYGQNAQGKTVFEPRDGDKGDAARALMYMTVCYTGVSGNLWALPSNISSSIPYGQDQNLLKKWHYQDPPDNLEIARNDYIDSLQGNRNPFIDSVHYACYIDFSNMTKINSPTLPCNNSVIGINEQDKSKDIVVIAPNPNNGNFAINYVTDKNKKVTVKIIDGVGRVIYNKQEAVNNGFNNINVDIENLSTGIYLLELTSGNTRVLEKLLID